MQWNSHSVRCKLQPVSHLVLSTAPFLVMHSGSVQKYFLSVIKRVWAHKMQTKYESFKKIVYWYLKRKLKVCNHVISQSGNWFTVKMLGNTIQINYTNIFFRKLQGTEVAKKRWRKNIYPRNMIIFCNHRYSRSLKLSPYHNRAVQWSSMRDMLFIFFPHCFYTKPSDCIHLMTPNR